MPAKNSSAQFSSRFPEYISIKEKPPLAHVPTEPTIFLGDLVAWRNNDDFKLHDSRTFGLVLSTRWTLNDWESKDNPTYFAEAHILWQDQTETKSSHLVLQVLSRPVQET